MNWKIKLFFKFILQVVYLINMANEYLSEKIPLNIKIALLSKEIKLSCMTSSITGPFAKFVKTNDLFILINYVMFAYIYFVLFILLH